MNAYVIARDNSCRNVINLLHGVFLDVSWWPRGHHVAQRWVGGGNAGHTKAASKFAHVQISNCLHDLTKKVYHITCVFCEAPAQPFHSAEVARMWQSCVLRG